jgi:hypothetical protein
VATLPAPLAPPIEALLAAVAPEVLEALRQALAELLTLLAHEPAQLAAELEAFAPAFSDPIEQGRVELLDAVFPLHRRHAFLGAGRDERAGEEDEEREAVAERHGFSLFVAC